jgi:hypothetical protein
MLRLKQKLYVGLYIKLLFHKHIYLKLTISMINHIKKTAPFEQSFLIIEIVSLISHVVKTVTFVIISIVISIISFGIVNQLESVICIFKEKITNPEIKISVDIYSFVTIR